MIEIGYSDYYNNVYRYSPEKVYDRYKQTAERLNSDVLKSKSTEYNPNSSKNLAIRESNKNFADWSSYVRSEHKTKLAKHDSISLNMANLLKNNNIKLTDEDNLLIYINPYSYNATITGTNNLDVLSQITNLINGKDNSKNLMFYALNFTQNLNSDSVIKYKAYQEVKKYTGLSLSELNLKDGEFYTEDGSALSDLLKTGIQKSSIKDAFKDIAYNYAKGLVDVVAKKGWNCIDDLNIALAYSNKNGFYTLNNFWEA